MQDYKKLANQYAIEMIVYNPSGINYCSQTFDSIIDRAIKTNFKYLVIFDDDVFFKMRNPDITRQPVYITIPNRWIIELFYQTLDLLSPELPFICLNPILSRSQYHLLKFCAPLQNTYFYYLDHLREHKDHRFWKGEEIEARCDLNLTLHLLTTGFLTAYSATFLVNSTEVNHPGGCSLYRTIEMERASVEYLKRTYPKFVSTKKKRGWVGEPDLIRDAPFISWKQALNQERFEYMFNISALSFCRTLILKYETIYSRFIKQIMSEPDTQKILNDPNLAKGLEI